MAQQRGNQKGVLRSLDWWTIAIYVALLVFGWISVCGASYTYGEVDIFSLDSRSGMQIIWIASSLCIATVLLFLNHRYYDTYAYLVYAILIGLLFLTIFNPHQIKGSRSWLVLGPLRVQPAEFAKFATALALAKFMGAYGYDIHQPKQFFSALAIIFVPMLFIVLQKETGSALVYLSFFLMFYREGMPGGILFTGIAAVIYFVVGIRFEAVMLWDTPTSLGQFVVLLLIQIFSASLVASYCRNGVNALRIGAVSVGLTLLALAFSEFVIPFNIVWFQLIVCVATVCWLLWCGLASRMRNYYFIALFSVGSLGFFYSADYMLNQVLEPHQRVRINVLLGLEEDLRGAGYNVHQSEIAIGSGGLRGKGFLNGTQTKLKYVPEQDTDFIFCTVGEEEGFVGSAGVLLLFLALVLRLIKMAERQPTAFGRIYGYSVMSIFLFHVFVNVGMVLGLTPVIGIPLPFFSYGGSSLWGFTILLFIFLRIDAGREMSNN